MENNACDNNRIAKRRGKNKVFVEFYQNLSKEKEEESGGQSPPPETAEKL